MHLVIWHILIENSDDNDDNEDNEDNNNNNNNKEASPPPSLFLHHIAGPAMHAIHFTNDVQNQPGMEILY